MAWRFRRSLKLGPLRLNLSKSGIGVSAGVRGFRVGTDAKGRTYTAASIPGTGLYNRAYYGASKPIAPITAPLANASPRPTSGIGLKLLIAFIAGGVVFSIIGAMMSSPPAGPPAPSAAAVIAPVVLPSVTPAKQRAHGAKRPKPLMPPHLSAAKASQGPQGPPDASPPAS